MPTNQPKIAYWTICLKNCKFLINPVFYNGTITLYSGKVIETVESIEDISERTKSTVIILETVELNKQWYTDERGMICLDNSFIGADVIDYMENFLLDCIERQVF